jgi:hypothetical protein
MYFRRVVTLLVCGGLSACTGDPGTGAGTAPVSVGSVSIGNSTAVLQYSQTVQLSPTVLSTAGSALPGRAVTWSSSNDATATVTSTGLVTAGAVRGGSAESVTITATSEGKSGSTSISIAPIPVATVAMSLASFSVFPGESTPLAVTSKDITGATVTGRATTWMSSAPAVATVSTQGIVTAAAVGNATITGTVEGKAATATVTVVMTPVATVTVSATTPTLTVDRAAQLTAVAKDSAGNVLTGRAVTWRSADTTLATVTTVTTAGRVTAVLPGSATVTATVEGKSGSATITVQAPVNATETTRYGITGYFKSYADEVPGRLPYGWGYSLYSAVYPENPDQTFMSLGAGNWLIPNAYENADNVMDRQPANPCGNGELGSFQSIEGGVGTWANLPFPTAGPNHLLMATANCYKSGVAGPAYLPIGSAPLPDNYLYFAQLSNRLLAPPGSLTIQPPTVPQLLGYGWIALPIIPANASPYGIKTGMNSWTLFMHAENFKGAVGFFTPAYWTAINVVNPGSIGYGLDTRPAIFSNIALEVGFTVGMWAKDSAGTEYRRVPRVTFGVDNDKRTVLIQDFQAYSKGALWSSVGSWVNGGAPVAQPDPSGIRKPKHSAEGERIHFIDASASMDLGVRSSAFLTSGGGQAWGLQWGNTLTAGTLPEYYKLVNGVWTAIPASEVPRRTWLTDQTFRRNTKIAVPRLNTTPSSAWSSARWAAGPFTTTLNNGSVVEYVWYRFTDQPAIVNLRLNAADRTKLQTWAESLHAQGVNGLTIAPPTGGRLASFDPGILVTPPAELGRGYVPIAIGQR